MSTHLSWWDCVNPDGSFNRSAILRIALGRARHGRNLEIVVANLGAPTNLASLKVPFSQLRGAYAQVASTLPRPADLKPWSDVLARELREVWDWARIIRDKVLRGERRAA